MEISKVKKRIKDIIKKISRPFKLTIDVSNCNLRCAMCPRGGVSGLKNEARELMDLEFFKRIIDKFIDEKVKVSTLEFGNWGEPLLNHDINKMITYARSKHGFLSRDGCVTISTNLTHLPDPAGLLESKVNVFRIAVSGMTREIYSKNHIGGNIEVVLKNILRLVDIRNKKKIKDLTLVLIYQDFVYNKREAELAKKFCEDHGLIFRNRRMYVCSVGENIKFHREKERSIEFYGQFIDTGKEMALMKTIDPKRVKDCHLRKNFVVINFDGRLYRCCGLFEEKHLLGPFFGFKIRDIPNIDSEICKECAKTPISWR